MGDTRDYDERTPYQLPFPKEAQQEIVIPRAIPEDERLWVPQTENVCFRPLCLNRSQGYWMNLLRVRKSGVLSRHRHPQPVHGFVLKGRQVNGVMCYVDPWGKVLGYEDVFTKIDLCKKHFEVVGLGADYVEQFIR